MFRNIVVSSCLFWSTYD